MNAGLKAGALEHLQHSGGDLVLAQRHEIERRAKSEFLLQLHETGNAAVALLPFHVMGEDQGKAFAVGPAGPVRRNRRRPRIHGPHIGKSTVGGSPHAAGAETYEDATAEAASQGSKSH